MATSYANPGGSGGRVYIPIIFTTTLNIVGTTIESLINGINNAGIDYFATESVSDKYLQFQFEYPVIIDEIKFYQSTTDSHGTYSIQACAEPTFASPTTLATGVVLGGVLTQSISFANTNAFLYYRLLGTSGSNSNNPYIYQFEFKIAWGAPAPQFAYANSMGSGNRTATITATSSAGLFGTGDATYLINGTIIGANDCEFADVTLDGSQYIKFDFGTPKIITEASWIQSSAVEHGTWKFQGSVSDGTTWVDIGSSFTLGGGAHVLSETYVDTITSLSGNTTAYRYYRLVGVSGSTSLSSYLWEIDFKIGDPVTNLTINGVSASAVDGVAYSAVDGVSV